MMDIQELLSDYTEVINETNSKHPNIKSEIDNLINDIFKEIVDTRSDLLAIREKLLIAYRLTESIKILGWIKVYLTIGAYDTIFKDLRFIIESMCQAFLIDLNHRGASIESKIEILKAISNIRTPQGNQLINKLNNFPNKRKLQKLYKELSGYVHPSYKGGKGSLLPSLNNLQDILNVKYDNQLINKVLANCKETVEYIIDINKFFQLKY